MSLPVVLRPEASRDTEEARDYLEAQQAGRGQAFLNRLNDALARIGAMPEMYGVVWQNVRGARELSDVRFIIPGTPTSANPVKAFLQGMHGEKEDVVLPVTAWRCAHCGLLELYARQEPEG